MATPLYKKMKSKGTSFYAFPSAAEDMNLAFSNDHYKLNFTKFVLLNIPEQEIVPNDQTKGKLNFDKNENGPKFFNFQPGGNNDMPVKFDEQLIESLRNYVANYDATMRESRINSNTDFYNINEQITPTEMIFWKWAKKYNLLDLEPALHNIDWNKNMSDFENTNGTTEDFFQNYLWKERDVNYYNCRIGQAGNKPELTIEMDAKFKIGDYVILSGYTGSELLEDKYIIIAIDTTTVNKTILTIDSLVLPLNYTTSTPYDCYVYLDYKRLIEYVGEIQAVSKIQTGRRNFTEVTAQIPHHCGKTPTILFDIETNNNYYPDLEMPILPQEQQEEIVGSEYTHSPIRLNPENYPGTYFGYFDTEDKTYICNSGNRLKNNGDYYGVLKTNNIGLDLEDNFEKLEDFNSNNIDGLKIDMNRDHYLKMNLPERTLKNFDEFNSAYFDKAPEDFNFNAILWYYELDDGSGTIINNLYGIEFLNNPSEDDDDCDVNDKLITPYKKIVSNGEQDGISYTFNLNINFNIDNDVLPLSYDPTTVYNQFGFELYQNILESNARLQDNFLSIINNFTKINDEIFDIKSLVYSQTDIDVVKEQINTMSNLLELYSTMQMVDGVGTQIETDFTGSFPTLKINVIDTKYASIENINIKEIIYYNNINSGVSYNIPIPTQNQILMNITNNNNEFNNDATILLSKDLQYKQSMDIYIKPDMSELDNKLDIDINFNDGSGNIMKKTLVGNLDLPIDIKSYNSIDPNNSIFTNSHYTNSNAETYGQMIITGITATTINMMEDLFVKDDIIYIDNFFLEKNNIITDFSGVYKIDNNIIGSDFGNNSSIELLFNSDGYTLKSKPKINYYKGWKINILRVSESNSSSIQDRYKITKFLL